MSNTDNPKVTERGRSHKDSLCTKTTGKSSKEAGNHRKTKVSKINIPVKTEEHKISGNRKKKDTKKLRKTSNLIRRYLAENKNKPENRVEVEEVASSSQENGSDLPKSKPANDTEQKIDLPHKDDQKTNGKKKSLE